MQLRMQPLSIKNFMQEGESLPEIFVAHHIPLAGMDFLGGRLFDLPSAAYDYTMGSVKFFIF